MTVLKLHSFWDREYYIFSSQWLICDKENSGKHNQTKGLRFCALEENSQAHICSQINISNYYLTFEP